MGGGVELELLWAVFVTASSGDRYGMLFSFPMALLSAFHASNQGLFLERGEVVGTGLSQRAMFEHSPRASVCVKRLSVFVIPMPCY